MTILQSFQSEWLFHRTGIEQGESWRILTGNLVHTNYYHLLMNLSGLAFICLLFKDFLSVKVYYLSLLITSLAVGLGIYFFSTNLIWYAGLSGSLYGLYMVAASSALKQKDYLTSLPILIGIPAKLIWDSLNSELTDSSAELIGAPVATDAHLYGISAGILISVIILISPKKTD
jgi:rhomboid family GlyGly-CTERM serine protease